MTDSKEPKGSTIQLDAAKLLLLGGASKDGSSNRRMLGAVLTCFLKGTRIRTDKGDRKVEDLAIGDLLPTVFGGVRPIQWIARYRYKKSDPGKSWVKDVRPVCIARSALAADVPHADLYLTQGHALFIDGVLVPVGSLINGTTITLCDALEFDELEYFHIKLESHDVIYAEGAPSETLGRVDENASNFAEYLRRYGAPPTAEPLCAPLLGYNGGRNEFKSRIRSAVSPWRDHREKIDIVPATTPDPAHVRLLTRPSRAPSGRLPIKAQAANIQASHFRGHCHVRGATVFCVDL